MSETSYKRQLLKAVTHNAYDLEKAVQRALQEAFSDGFAKGKEMALLSFEEKFRDISVDELGEYDD